MTDLFSKIKEVTEIPAISGHEAPVRDYLRQQLTPHVDEIVTDGLGGIFGVKHSTAADAPRILVAAHMDEVGFMISEIKADGTFRVVPIGGWNPMVVSSQRFKLFTRDGREYPAISGSVPPHLTRGTGGPTVPAISDIVFDAGFSSKAEAESYGIRPGDTLVPDSSAILTANGKNVISKAWDNRYGVLMVSELAKSLSGQALNNELYVGANVQEEVGLRGAHTSTTKFDPEIFLAVDCSPAADVFGDQGAIGEGTLLRFYDPGHIMLPNMKDFLLLARKELLGLPHTNLGKRTISPDIVQRSFGTAVIFQLTFLVGLLGICLVTPDGQRFIYLVFEVVSALATVGVTANVTSTLNGAGLAIIMVLMFIGRIGPLTLMVSLNNYQAKKADTLQYAKADIIIG